MSLFSTAILTVFLLPSDPPNSPVSDDPPLQERLIIDDVLGGVPRPFGRYPRTINFGPTGRRLWVNYLEEKPGFVGRIDFIQRLNIPSLFTLHVRRGNDRVNWKTARHTWYPSHLVMEFEAGDIRLREHKFITWNDVAVDVVEVSNGSTEPIEIEYESARLTGEGSVTAKAGVRLGVPVQFVGNVPEFPRRIQPGGRFRGTICVAAGLAEEDGLEARPASWAAEPNPLKQQKKEYQAWFDSVPSFWCDDVFITRAWAYRWYLLRRNLSFPAAGNLRYPFYLEGRGHKMSNDPWNPSGWEFSKLIPFSTPFHLLEGRWHPDVSPCEGELDNLIENQSEDGLFRWATVNGCSSYYSNFVPWAVRQLTLVHPAVEITPRRLDALKRNVRAWFELFDPDGNSLPHITNHNRTGKEYQPSYFYFDDYPRDAKKADKAVLERVDVASYQYMNATALSRLCTRARDASGAEEFSRLAEQITSAVLSRMWHPETAFFYDVRESDKQKAMVKNVVGFDPFMAGIAAVDHSGAFEHLWNSEEFWTPWPVPSVAIDCPAFAPDASWFGEHIKGPHGAVWNGPTWPLTDSTTLMALANATRMANHRWDHRFSDLFRRYTRLHFRDEDLDRPNLVEHYNPITGEPISEEEDYFHSSWIDLVVTCIVGLMPSEDETVHLDPIDCGLEFFGLQNLPYRGQRLTISWCDPASKDRKTDLPPGFSVRIDGKLIAQKARLEPVEAELPP